MQANFVSTKLAYSDSENVNQNSTNYSLFSQIASHSGYVQVDWKRVEKDVNKAKKQLKKRANKAAPEINTLIEEVSLW